MAADPPREQPVLAAPPGAVIETVALSGESRPPWTEPGPWGTTFGVLGLWFAIQIAAYLLALFATIVLTTIHSAPGHAPSVHAILRGQAGQVWLTISSIWLVSLGASLAAVILVRRHPAGWRERLGLRVGRIPTRDFPLMVGATLGAFGFGLVLVEALRAAGVHLAGGEMARLMAAVRAAGVPAKVALLLGGTVVTGFGEEVLFRGLLQRRLLQAWGPAAALVTTALLFDLVHVEPVRLVGVAAICAWQGYLAWRADSIVPGIVCHACVNAAGQSLVLFAPGLDVLREAPLPPWLTAAGGALSLALVAAGIRVAERRARSLPAPAAAPVP